MTESEFWTAIQGTTIDNPTGLFSSPVAVRVMELLRVLRGLNGDIGVTRYEVTVDDVVDHLARDLERIGMQPVGRSKMYSLLRAMAGADLVQQQTINTVPVYKETPITSLFNRDGVECYMIDNDGNSVLPQVLQNEHSRVFLENGEKTLKTYNLTTRGSILLGIYLKTR